MYNVFHRTWWKHNNNGQWPDNLEPFCGPKTYIAKRVDTEAEAQQLCEEYNDSHDEGKLSDKAEYEDA